MRVRLGNTSILGGAPLDNVARVLTSATYGYGSLMCTVDRIPHDMGIEEVVARVEAEIGRVGLCGFVSLGEEAQGSFRTATITLAEDPAVDVVDSIVVGGLVLRVP